MSDFPSSDLGPVIERPPANQYDEACARAKALGCNCDSPDWGEHWPGVIEGAEGPARCPLAPNLFKSRVAALLREIEGAADLWISQFAPVPGCPKCRHEKGKPHAPDCALAALLKECEA